MPAQQTWVAQIPTSKGTAFVWMGDRWGSRPDGIKGHDFQFWSAPMQFAPDGAILPLEFAFDWQADVPVSKLPAPSHPAYIWPKQKDPHPLEVDPCTGQRLPPE